MNKKLRNTLIICFIILVVATAILLIIFNTEPTAEKAGATKETPMLVNVSQVSKGEYRPEIIATGTVQPSKDITLSPRVSGEIVKISPSFVPGGYVKKGEVLFQIDPADYKIQLQLRKSELEQMETDLAIEQGQQEIAEKDFQLVEELVSLDDKSLVLRKPQLDAIKAQVKAAEASVDQAQLNLNRTTIRAPFDAQILNRNANLGSQVAPGNNLGRLVGIEEYWVMLTIPRSKLPQITLPKPNRNGSKVIIKDKKAWKTGDQRTGEVMQLVGALENQTRLARLVVKVEDPLGIDDSSLPQLMINSFVEAEIQAEPIKNVVRLPRDYLRENETVWVMQNNELKIRKIETVFMDAKYAYVKSGLNDGDQIVTTNLSTVAEGANLRTADQEMGSESNSDSSKTAKTSNL